MKSSLQELDDVELEISALSARQERLRHFIHAHTCLSSAFRQIMGDNRLLAAIFQLTTDSDGYNPLCQKEIPLVLASVCRQWRYVACSTPSLWTQIYLSVPGYRTSPIAPFLSIIHERGDRLKQWLERSRGERLHVYVNASANAEVSDATQAIELRKPQRQLASLLLPHSSMFISLTLNIPSYMQDVFGCIPVTQLKHLQTFRLLDSRPRESLSNTHPLDTIFRAPGLQKLHIHTPYYQPPVRWDQLTEIDIKGSYSRNLRLTSERAIEILRLASASLRVFRLGVWLVHHEIHPITLHMSHLQTAHFNIVVDEMTPAQIQAQIHAAFGTISAPNLVSFAVQVVDLADHPGFETPGVTTWPWPGMFQHSILENIEELYVHLPHSMPLPLDLLLDTLDSLSRVTKLTLAIHDLNVAKSLMSALSHSIRTPYPVCPRLTFLRMDFDVTDAELEQAVLAFAYAKSNDHAGTLPTIAVLEMLEVFCTDPPNLYHAFRRELERLRSQGMVVRWETLMPLQSGFLYRGEPWQSEWDRADAGYTDCLHHSTGRVTGC
ncbi:hypothetical protein VNI00_018851 [Paramarasmius palmivorus]|uniref:F-box domain-containing protein n=1 Tax=Paramarasmius palmivorus TaxID=297713 RepID=A0AAW0AVK3_9AGAR